MIQAQHPQDAMLHGPLRSNVSTAGLAKQVHIAKSQPSALREAVALPMVWFDDLFANQTFVTLRLPSVAEAWQTKTTQGRMKSRS
eukprot:1469295-Amphidinium_carterae.2